MEYLSCDLCGSDRRKLLFGERDLLHGRTRGIVRCRGCGLVYRNLPHLEPQHYEQRDYSNPSEDWVTARRDIFLDYLDSLEAYRQCNRILDVGAGHGFFLSVCADRGWDCHGVEISRQSAEYARRQFGLNLTCSSLEEARYPEEFFDLVTFWNVLDHLPSPKGALRETHRVLRHGGAIIARAPNADFHVPVRRFFLVQSHLNKKLRQNDPSVFHLFSFDRRSVTRLLEESGFRDVRVSNAPLAWTSMHSSQRGLGKRITARLVYELARFFHAVSWKKLLISPSFLVIARKADPPTPRRSGTAPELDQFT